MVMQHMFFPPALKIKRQHTHNTQKRTHLFSSQSLVPCKNTTEYLFLSLQKYVYKYCKRYWNTDILLHVQLHIFLVQPVYGYRIWATSHTHGFYIKTAGVYVDAHPFWILHVPTQALNHCHTVWWDFPPSATRCPPVMYVSSHAHLTTVTSSP